MNCKIKSLEKNNMLEIAGRQEAKKLVGFTWIYTVEHKLYGTLNCYRVKVVQKIYI